MTTPFVAGLRARPEHVRLGRVDEHSLTVRVEIPELWDVVRIDVPPEESALAVKVAALAALDPGADHRAYVLKLRGWEVLDEHESLARLGVVNGSIFLLTHRRRRPVR